MSDIELSDDSDEMNSHLENGSAKEIDSSEDLSVYEEKKPQKKPEDYDGVPDVSSSESGDEHDSEDNSTTEQTTSESPPTEEVAKPKKERSYMNHRERGLKSLKQKLREKAFKKAELAGNDPALISHRMERRALADRLEEDSEFREQYIKEQEEVRRVAVEAENGGLSESELNYSNTSELIDQVNRLQAQRRGDNISSSQSFHSSVLDSDDEDATPDESYSVYTYPTSQSSLIDDDDIYSGKPRRSRKQRSSGNTQNAESNTYVPTRDNAPGKAGIYIHIENLTLNL
jgi:hypothetical protein